jgi:hypothetical protein
MPDLRYVANDEEPSIRAITRTIGILIFPDFQLLDAAGLRPFEVAGRQPTPKAYRLRVLARTAAPVVSLFGGDARRRAAVAVGRQVKS